MKTLKKDNLTNDIKLYDEYVRMPYSTKKEMSIVDAMVEGDGWFFASKKDWKEWKVSEKPKSKEKKIKEVKSSKDSKKKTKNDKRKK